MTFMQIEVGPKFEDMCESLKLIPKLKGFNLTVTEQAPEDYAQHLAMVDQTSLINWSGGTIDAALMTELNNMYSLKTLRFQSDATIAKDFADGLVELKSLRGLSLNVRNIECPPAELHEALCKLPELKHWPELKKPGKAVLKAMAKCKEKTWIQISGLGPDASAKDLVAAISDPSVTYLDLDEIPMTPDVVRAIQNCPQLENLALNFRELNEPLFKNPVSFKSLKSLDLSMTSLTCDLDSIAGLPNLERLSLHCISMTPDYLGFVADCKTLDSLSITGGYSDDSTAKIIGESKKSHVGESWPGLFYDRSWSRSTLQKYQTRSAIDWGSNFHRRC